MRGIRINLGSNFIIAAICFLFSVTGIFFGRWIGAVLPGDLPDIVGSVLLFLIGVRILLIVLPRTKENPAGCAYRSTSRRLKLVQPRARGGKRQDWPS